MIIKWLELLELLLLELIEEKFWQISLGPTIWRKKWNNTVIRWKQCRHKLISYSFTLFYTDFDIAVVWWSTSSKLRQLTKSLLVSLYLSMGLPNLGPTIHLTYEGRYFSDDCSLELFIVPAFLTMARTVWNVQDCRDPEGSLEVG